MNTRDYRIDVLRSIGILLILLAHTSPPSSIVNIRTFDVPLLTMMMSMSFYLTFKADSSYYSYLKKRFKRLIIPAWIFLSIFFILFFVVNLIVSNPFHFDLDIIAKSYTLISGIGYVWIIRVFFTVAIFSPILLKIVSKISKLQQVLPMIGILLIIQQLLVTFTKDLSGLKYILFNSIIASSFGYLILALIGMYIIKQSTKGNLILLSFFAFIFIFCLFFYNEGVSMFKYPPAIYYISYGVVITLIFWFILSIPKVLDKLNNKYSIWLSVNSLNVYYWHIIPVFFIDHYTTEINWILMYVIITSFAIFVTLIQNKYLPNLFNPKLKKPA